MITPITPLVVNGYLMKPSKVILLAKKPYPNITLHSVDINNALANYAFDDNGEVVFTTGSPIGLWLSFDQFTSVEVPHIRVIFSGDKIIL